ncbi:GGDEF domain-containing protein [Roseateles sp. LYH14W]|uniref:diguanylate cyclase n=1 Tax=Pelomonas parva TaxID=3299032 RepID=A0ABW7FBV2_9BURK
MRAPSYQPLARRLIKAIVLWGALATFIWTAAMGVWARRESEHRLQSALLRYTESVAMNVAEALWQVSPDLVQGHLDTALGIPGVGYIAVRDKGGNRPFAAAGIASLADGTEPLRFPIRLGAAPPAHQRQVDVRTVGAVLGNLEVFPDPSALRREAASQVLRALVPGLVLTGVLLLIALGLVHRRVHQPLSGLSDFLGRLRTDAHGEPPVWTPPRGRVPDELDRVADSLAGLQQRVADHVQQLDARVAERTGELQQALEQLRHLSSTDPLTGCRNRMAFNEAMAAAIAQAARYDRPLTVVMCDVDLFKSINDSWGHLVGDRVLAAVGATLRQALRAGPDWVARYGGEEFVLVLPETPLMSAIEATERVRHALAEEVRVPLESGEALGATASFGVAQWHHGESVERLLERADAQLYAAKRAGRNCVMPPLEVLA